MENLAGRKDCDKCIREELSEAGIGIENMQAKGEVPYTIGGRIGNKFIFKRAWYYWIVKGLVPLSIAKKLYNDPVGKKDIRVAGNCTCPPPHEWAFPVGKELAKQLIDLGIEHINYGELRKLCENGTITADRFVDTYHIDTQRGLNLFVKTLGE